MEITNDAAGERPGFTGRESVLGKAIDKVTKDPEHVTRHRRDPEHAVAENIRRIQARELVWKDETRVQGRLNEEYPAPNKELKDGRVRPDRGRRGFLDTIHEIIGRLGFKNEERKTPNGSQGQESSRARRGSRERSTRGEPHRGGNVESHVEQLRG